MQLVLDAAATAHTVDNRAVRTAIATALAMSRRHLKEIGVKPPTQAHIGEGLGISWRTMGNADANERKRRKTEEQPPLVRALHCYSHPLH